MLKDECLINPKYFWVRRSDNKTEFTCALCQSTCKLSDLGSAALDHEYLKLDFLKVLWFRY